MVHALSEEISQRQNYITGHTVSTVYFGGGTPSLIGIDALKLLLGTVQEIFEMAADAEITLEANPDDLTLTYLHQLRHAGFNRLSIGVQSFRESDLQYLGRLHTSEKAMQTVADAKLAGFENISIDLIYGIPGLSAESWQQNLDHAFALEIPHISAYSLTVEPRTPLETLIRKGTMQPVDEALAVQHYHQLTIAMQNHGYEHYEISNFCLPGCYSKHNTAYWQNVPYLGIGPSAHSFDGESRQWNVSSVGSYIDSVKSGNVACERETLSLATRFNEYIMTSLRTQWGCDLGYIVRSFGLWMAENLLQNAEKFIAAGEMQNTGNSLVLTASGKLFADRISADLFVLEEE